MASRSLPPLANSYSGVFDAVAKCDECDALYDNRKNAVALGNQHARRTGHQVHWEQTIGGTYNRKEGIAKDYDGERR